MTGTMRQGNGEQFDVMPARKYHSRIEKQKELEHEVTRSVIEAVGEIEANKQMVQEDKWRTKFK